MISNKTAIFEDISYDPSLGVYIKYAHSRSETGDFVQAGILADNIKNLTERFSVNNLLHILSEEEETLNYSIWELGY